MFRKLMTLTALVSLLVLSACNSITGPAATGPKVLRSAGGGGDKPPQVYEKVCLSDLRAVEITGPGEGTLVYAGDTELVTWETREVCGRFTAELLVSLDNGQTFQSQGEYKNATSATWKAPNVDGAQVILKVVLQDREGELSDEMAFANRLVGIRNGRGGSPQDQTPGD